MAYLCPICNESLILDNKSYRCINNHSFDVSRSGYVNLNCNNSSKSHGDNKLMVNSRTSFLNKDYYLPLKEALIEILKELSPKICIDCGCGEGYYTRGFSGALEDCEVYGFDLSKEAIHEASKSDKIGHYAISSIFKIPMADDVSDVLLSLFAPLALDEFDRLLKSHGHLIVVCPEQRHLFELKEVLYQDVYLNEVESVKDDRFELIEMKKVETKIQLESQEDIANLFTMTPYYYKTRIEDKQKLSELSSLDVTISFSIQLYRKK